MLLQLGVASIQNLWLILKPTWLHQIKQHSSNQMISYFRHIETGNNGNFEQLQIGNDEQREIFLSTLSMVFKISITINIIERGNHVGKLFNSSSINNNPAKIINVRKSISGHNVYEPWINPLCLTMPKVKFFTALR